jgi:hypothetical protein
MFWAEKLVLVITQQILPRNVEKTFFHCIFGSINLPFPDQIHFNVPGLPVDRFSIFKKHFFIITNNVKGFLLRWRKAHGGLDPSKSHLQAN